MPDRQGDAGMNLARDTLALAGGECLSARHAENIIASGGQLVDVRSPADFSRDGLPGARNLPLDALFHDYHHLDKTVPVILYGNQDVACVRAARLLAGRGFSRIYHLKPEDD
jgi:rhodanese-related sulfurtransferase